ncbi:MAG TPA: hypothetical protein VN181_08290 [Thermoanaerobaculia bacterium]|nr:hypothetical protein [Thermoanaerobaculia bacterium]
MIDEEIAVGAHRVLVQCDRSVQRQGKWLLDTIKRETQRNLQLRDGVRVEVGWSVVTLRAMNAQDFRVYEPDFSVDPFTQVRADVTTTLKVIAEQNDFLRLARAVGVSVRFDQKVVVSEGVLALKSVYLERSRDITRNDSGWYVGPVEGGRAALQGMYIYQLLARPEFMQVLTLPSAYLVIFDGAAIRSVTNERDQDVWGEVGQRG